VAKNKKAATSQAALKRKAKQLLACRDAGREAYTQADKLLEELLDAGLKPGDSIALTGGVTMTIVDNFVDRQGKPTNKLWKPTGVNRLDVKVEHAK